jgi:tRNA(Ile)-lysidine synthase
VSEFLQRLEAEIQSRCRPGRSAKILAGVSGGLDSMALLHVLRALAGKWCWKIVVAHFNHQLRGRSSDEDEKLVRKTAARLGLPFIAGRANVKRFAQKSKLSIEMAARKLRHEFFARAAVQHKTSTVALAHHADDQVELFFLRVLRGAGGEGVAGMKWLSLSPVNSKIKLIRPLLGFSKAEILTYARGNKIPFREDASNLSKDFLRNRVRNELLPLLRKHYQPGLTKTVLRLMEIAGAEAEAVGGLAGQWLKQRRPDFEHLPAAVQRRILQSQLIRLKVSPDFDLVELLRRAADVAVSVDSKCSVSRNPAGDVKLQHDSPEVRFKADELALNLTGRAAGAEFGGASLNWQFDTGKKSRHPIKKSGREYFDASKVGDRIILRHWRPGDRFQPIGLKTGAKLQDLFTNAKIPRARRRDLLVAAVAGGEIFWVEGLRISENFKLTAETGRRLAWRWRRPAGRDAKTVPARRQSPVKVLYTGAMFP